jgi:isoquinoline 1-oxidoreductase beta subunit
MRGLTRRAFLKASGLGAGTLVLGCRSSGSWPAGPDGSETAIFDAWLAITSDDRILVQVDKVEMGQGTHTAYATLIAEELRTPPERIEIRNAPVDDAFSNPMQMTGGSQSMRDIWEPLRLTGARAREMLRSAAAERFDVEATALEVADGRVHNPASGEALSFGALAASAAGRRAPRNPALTPPDRYRFIGTSFPRVDAKAKSTGTAEYGMDVTAPGLLTAVVVHCPHARGTLRSFDAAAASVHPGVVDVFEIPSGIAVVARGYWPARTAAKKLVVEWDAGESAGVDTASIRAGLANALDESIAGDDLHSARNDGDTTEALAGASQRVEAEYRLPYLAHATMEPVNCTVIPREGGCDVHVGTQTPDGVQDAVASVLGLSRDDVVVHTVFLGGGFGRRAFTDMATEAAWIAREAGAPVKLVWSREDDMARDYYRPPSFHRLAGGLDTDGKLTAWEHHLACPSLIPYFAEVAGTVAPQWMRGFVNAAAGGLSRALPRWVGPILGVEGAADQPYAAANVSVGSIAWDPGIPVGIWRSVGHSHNGFVVESFVDELARAAGADPAAFRRRHLVGRPRHVAVLDLLVERGRWGKAAPGRHQGIAVHEAFGSVAGQIAEVSVEGNEIRVHHVTCVIDCGLAVNPDIVKAQMESGILFGLTAALYGEINFKDGAAIESNFHEHRMLRLADAPDIDVIIVPSSASPSGVGEPGTPPIAPAVANAIFDATGVRLRELPLRLG